MPEPMIRSSSIVSYFYPKSLPAYGLFFSDSGHGGQIRDMDGDEVDGFDEGA
jgi:hypothetical protein